MEQYNKKYIALNQEGEHEFNITVEVIDKGTKYSIFASNNDIWTEQTKNELLLSMIDTGDDIKFDRRIRTMDYEVVQYVRILLQLEVFLDTNLKDKYKLIEENVIIELC